MGKTSADSYASCALVCFFCPFVTPSDTLDNNLVIFQSGARVFRLMVQINVVFDLTSLCINGRGMLSDMNQRHKIL